MLIHLSRVIFLLLFAGVCMPASAQKGAWDKLNKQGEEYFYQNDYPKAKDCFVRGLPLAEKEFYPAGTWGPEAADELLVARGHQWRNPTPTH